MNNALSSAPVQVPSLSSDGGPYARHVKRWLDLAIAFPCLVASSPVLLVVAFLVWAFDGWPVGFAHPRVGLHGRPFTLLKFRTMIRGADKAGPSWTDPGDPRVTRLGAFLRCTSLDELPQLINVIRGDMSMVGPRPDTHAQFEALSEPDRRQRSSVRPGITGLAQTSGRSALTPERRLELDLYYTRRVSLVADLRIILATALQVVTGRGAAW